jgi:sortase A
VTHVRVRQGAHLLGEVFITLGVVALLFALYLVVWTNVRSHAEAAALTDDLRRQWADAPHSTATPSGGPTTSPAPVVPVPGKPFAIMTIPRLGRTWSAPVLEAAQRDISLDELAQGVVHYRGTALPGQVGNFAVAGHRATHGQPFADLDRVRKGDLVVVETDDAVYTYVVDADPVIVQPTDVAVIDPVPGQPGAKPTKALITLTTCNPRWNSSHRLIVFGHLESTRAK